MDQSVRSGKIILLTIFYGIPVVYVTPYMIGIMGLIVSETQLSLILEMHRGELRGIDGDSANVLFLIAAFAAYIAAALIVALPLVMYQGFIHALMYSYRFVDGFQNFFLRGMANSWFFMLALGAPPMSDVFGYWESMSPYYVYYLWVVTVGHVLTQHKVHMRSLPSKS